MFCCFAPQILVPIITFCHPYRGRGYPLHLTCSDSVARGRERRLGCYLPCCVSVCFSDFIYPLSSYISSSSLLSGCHILFPVWDSIALLCFEFPNEWRIDCAEPLAYGVLVLNPTDTPCSTWETFRMVINDIERFWTFTQDSWCCSSLWLVGCLLCRLLSFWFVVDQFVYLVSFD